MDDDGHAISYKLLVAGTAVHAATGELLGTVVQVLESEREHIFDGIVIVTDAGRRFVDAPEVARITERRVTLTISAAEAAELEPPEPPAPSYRADVRGGRIRRRFFGGRWRRH